MIRPFKDHRGRSCHQISAKNSRKCLRYIYFRFRRIFHEFFAVILTNNLLTILVFTYYYISAGRSRKDNMEIARLNLGLICVSEFRFLPIYPAPPPKILQYPFQFQHKNQLKRNSREFYFQLVVEFYYPHTLITNLFL